jgi:hypothetical protein
MRLPPSSGEAAQPRRGPAETLPKICNARNKNLNGKIFSLLDAPAAAAHRRPAASRRRERRTSFASCAAAPREVFHHVIERSYRCFGCSAKYCRDESCAKVFEINHVACTQAAST